MQIASPFQIDDEKGRPIKLLLDFTSMVNREGSSCVHHKLLPHFTLLVKREEAS
jgi:hypothetical protein